MDTSPLAQPAIEIRDLSKSFYKLTAVNHISFEVKEGEFFAFLGENGAGKSTTIHMLSGQLTRDSGEIKIFGESIDQHMNEISRSIGIVFQKSVLDRPFTVLENLKSRAALYGIHGEEFKKRVSELSPFLDLDPILRRPLSKLSGGQLRRADIARALLHDPKILILDEPTTGLDPKTRKAIWQIIDHLRKTEKLTVFLTTHYMEETADADHIIILDHGEIAAEGTPHDLKNRFAEDHITFYHAEEKDLRRLGRPFERLSPGVYRMPVSNSKEAARLIADHPDVFQDFEITKGKMDDVFLAITGKPMTEDEK
ncbi:MAG: ABC transporter ATP-binding protein [Eubacteriales bacterium]|nr:ABC transporter ATP-binding protein [Eubacteriales bacterium]